MLLNNGPFLSRPIPAAAIQAFRYSLEIGMAGHLVPLAAFLMEPEP
jgi:hypothetical protein